MNDGTRILIVDDDPNLRKTLADILKVKGYEVSSAANGAEAFDFMSRSDANLAIIDLGLPDVSGLEVLGRVKAHNPLAEAIILTGNASVDSAMEAINKGAFSYLMKPYEMDELMLHIRRALEKQTAQETIARHNKELEGINAQLSTANSQLMNEIGERKQAEELLGRIFANSPMAIFIISHGKVQMANRQFELLTGCSEDEWMGRSPTEIVHQEDKEKVSQCGRRMLKGELALPYEYRVITKSGEVRTFMETVTPIQYRGATAVLGNFVDITDRKMLESQLIQAQKLESVGQLAAGIAHEINTPAQYVGDNIHFLHNAFQDTIKLVEYYGELLDAVKMRSTTDEIVSRVEGMAEEIDFPYLTEEIPKAIGQSLEGIERVSKIVSAMREFSHPGTDEKTLVDINRAIENTIVISRNEWKYVADVETELDTSLCSVPCLPAEFNQVILNIIVNAAQAIGGAADREAKGMGKIVVTTHRSDGKAEVRISDTGPGIPDSIKPRIFDPFFTTKELGKGTGQGLAITRSVIVDKHGGTITCEDRAGGGATFVIRLPLDESRKGT